MQSCKVSKGEKRGGWMTLQMFHLGRIPPSRERKKERRRKKGERGV